MDDQLEEEESGGRRMDAMGVETPLESVGYLQMLTLRGEIPPACFEETRAYLYARSATRICQGWC